MIGPGAALGATNFDGVTDRRLEGRLERSLTLIKVTYTALRLMISCVVSEDALDTLHPALSL